MNLRIKVGLEIEIMVGKRESAKLIMERLQSLKKKMK